MVVYLSAVPGKTDEFLVCLRLAESMNLPEKLPAY